MHPFSRRALLALPLFVAFAASADEDVTNTIVLKTKYGDIVIRLRPDLASKHVTQIQKLVKRKFYDGVVFHRVIPGFMAQTGDPTGTGMGGSDLPNIPAEFSKETFKRGTVGMARASYSGFRKFAVFHLLRRCFVPGRPIYDRRRSGLGHGHRRQAQGGHASQ